jgi:hypothetical protein
MLRSQLDHCSKQKAVMVMFREEETDSGICSPSLVEFLFSSHFSLRYEGDMANNCIFGRNQGANHHMESFPMHDLDQNSYLVGMEVLSDQVSRMSIALSTGLDPLIARNQFPSFKDLRTSPSSP